MVGSALDILCCNNALCQFSLHSLFFLAGLDTCMAIVYTLFHKKALHATNPQQGRQLGRKGWLNFHAKGQFKGYFIQVPTDAFCALPLLLFFG